jgi:hypothetical protein
LRSPLSVFAFEDSPPAIHDRFLSSSLEHVVYHFDKRVFFDPLASAVIKVAAYRIPASSAVCVRPDENKTKSLDLLLGQGSFNSAHGGMREDIRTLHNFLAFSITVASNNPVTTQHKRFLFCKVGSPWDGCWSHMKQAGGVL